MSLIWNVETILLNLLKQFSIAGLLIVIFPQISCSQDAPKMILIHLDSASGEYFQRELQKGNLPNIARYFGEQGIINYTITYFPSKTPTVVSSIRGGDPTGEVILPGWEWYQLESENVVKTTSTFLKMALSTSRLSITNIIYGLPIFNWLAGPALLNTADYLQDYNVLQFYWYNIDTEGHFNGEEAYISEFSKFDRQFGKLIKRLDDDVNIVIYSDHGMVFGEGIKTDRTVKRIAGQSMSVYSYPSLYLKDVGQAENISKSLVRNSAIDFTFYKSGDNQITGFHEDGTIYFNHSNGKVNYEFTGKDVLNFYKAGYDGEYRDRKEWLDFSYNLQYPMAPTNIYFFLQHPNAGHVLTLFDDTKYHRTGYSSSGSHGGFTSVEMSVPLLVKGREVENLYNRTYYWLPDLFKDIEGIDFDQHPPRERHFINSRYDFSKDEFVQEISFSPKYRIHFGASVYNAGYPGFSEFDRADLWGKADIFRSYLSRLWVGTGVELKSRSENKPLLILQYDIHIRRFTLKNSFATNRPFYFRLSYQVNDWFSLENVNLTSLGTRFEF